MGSVNSDAPLVSIVAVSYNHEEWIVETLDSIRSQTSAQWELIYADDASQDRSVGRALEWLNSRRIDARTIIHEKNQGFCRTLNEALRFCRGKYVQIIACDDTMEPDKLSRHCERLEAAGPDAAVIFSDAFLIDRDGNRLADTFLSKWYEGKRPPEGDVFTRLLQKNFVPAMSALVRRDPILAVSGYDEDLAYEDYDMWLRLSRTYEFIFDDEISASYRLHHHNFHSTLHFDDHRYWIYRKHLDCEAGREAFARVVQRLFRASRLSDAQWLDLRSSLPPELDSALLRLFVRYHVLYVYYRRVLRMRYLVGRLKRWGAGRMRARS